MSDRVEVWARTFLRTPPRDTARILRVARDEDEEEAALAGLIRSTIPPDDPGYIDRPAPAI